MLKIKLLTHNDLDGIGCKIVADILFPKEYKIDTVYCTVGNVEEMLSETILKLNEYDEVFLTDISVSKKYVEWFFTPEVVKKIHIFDHHKTARDLNQYEFAQICVEENETLMSGTQLFYDYLKKRFSQKYMSLGKYQQIKLDEFVELVRQYDTWEWVKNNNLKAKNINDLMYIKGYADFIEELEEVMEENGPLLFKESDILLLKYENQRKENYIKSKEKLLIPFSLKKYHIGVVFAEQYVSELGNQLALSHPEYDIIAIVGAKNVSLRTVKGIDVSDIAKQYGGGGHEKAAGFPVDSNKQILYLKSLFKGDKA